MVLRRLGLALVALLILPVAADQAIGQELWTHTANSCAIDNSDVDEFDPNASNLKFNRFSRGTLVARCNVTNPRDDGGDPSWSALEVVYRDPDGTDTRNRVRAKLVRVGNGGNTTTIADFDSDLFPDVPDAALQAVDVSHAFDFGTGAYYVELKVSRERTGSSNDPAAYLVRLRP